MKDVAIAVALGDTEPTAGAVLSYLRDTRGADELGLTEHDFRYLSLLYPDKRKGRDQLAVELGEDPTTVDSEIEPYLLRLGLVDRTPAGRQLSRTGHALVTDHGPSLRVEEARDPVRC